MTAPVASSPGDGCHDRPSCDDSSQGSTSILSTLTLTLQYLVFAALLVFGGNTGSVYAMTDSDCSVAGDNGTDATLFEHRFDSGAAWSLCWYIDDAAGLTITDLHYAAPAEQARQLIEQASIGQILLKYDEDISYSHLLSDRGLGGTHIMQPTTGFCDASNQIVSTANPEHRICTRFRDLNLMIQLRDETPQRRHEISLHSWSRIDNFIYQTIWRFSEDGEFRPSVEISGKVSRFTDDERFGSLIGNAAPAYDDGDGVRLASNATFLISWRLHFDLNGDSVNDQIHEVEFPIEQTDAVRRPIALRLMETEELRKVDRELFRGWRISDEAISSSQDTQRATRIAYYLDPQPSGFEYAGRRHNWTLFDIAVTRFNNCEQLSSNNSSANSVNADCADNIDFYTDGEALSGDSTVVWFNLARHFAPDREDYPAIRARQASFGILPYDWSAHTPFNPRSESP